MKANRLHKLSEATAALWLSIGIVNGASAYTTNNESIRAQAIAETHEVYGNPEAASWRAYANNQEDERNRLLLLSVGGLSTAVMFGVAAVSGARGSSSEQRLETGIPTQ